MKWYTVPRHVGKTSLVDLKNESKHKSQEQSFPLIRVVLVEFANQSVAGTLVYNDDYTTPNQVLIPHFTEQHLHVVSESFSSRGGGCLIVVCVLLLGKCVLYVVLTNWG